MNVLKKNFIFSQGWLSGGFVSYFKKSSRIARPGLPTQKRSRGRAVANLKKKMFSRINPIPPKPFFQATFEFWFLGLSNR